MGGIYLIREAVKKRRNNLIGKSPKVVKTHTPLIWDSEPTQHRFGTFTANLPKNFDPRGVKYGEKTVIFKSLGPPDPTHPHLELFPNETVFLRLPLGKRSPLCQSGVFA